MFKRKILALLLLTCLFAGLIAVPASQALAFSINLDSVKANGNVKVTVNGEATKSITFDWEAGSGIPSATRTLTTDSEQFTLKSIPAGAHTLSYTYDNDPATTGTLSVTVAGQAAITIGSAKGGTDSISVSGKGEAGETVEIYLFIGANDWSQGTALIDGDGNYSFSKSNPAYDAGDYNVRVVAVAPYAAASAETSGLPVTITDPINLTVTSADPYGANGVRVTGNGAPGASVNVTVIGGKVATVTVAADGKYDAIISGLAAGTYSNVRVEYVGPNTGNRGSDPANPIALSSALNVAAASTHDLKITDTPTAVGSVTVKGTGKAGANVTATVGGKSGGTTVAADGSFSVTISLAGGTYNGAQVAYDAAGIGNGDTTSNAIVVPGTATATPGPTSTPVPTPKDLSITNVAIVGRNQLRVTGTGAANGQAKLDVLNGPSLNITLDASGNFDEIIPNLPVYTYTKVTASYVGTSAAYGANASKTGSWQVLAATTDDITITKVVTGIGTVTIEGKAKANTAVTAVVGSYSGGSTADASGNYSIRITLLPGTYTGAQARYNTSGIGNSASIADKIVVPGTNVTPAPTAVPTNAPTTDPGGTYPTLSRGMINSYVTTLQQYLQSLGYYTIKVDGNFGVGTQTAVRNFQILNSLPATGIADDATQKKLYSGTAVAWGGVTPNPGGYTTLSFGSRGTEVRNLQVRLANLSYYYGSIDGIFGSQSEAAVRNFQSRNNLAVTGIADSATQTAAYSSTALANGSSSGGYVYLHYGSKGTAVTRLQTALKNAGYYKGAIDGQYFDQTYSAVKSFQRANGLVVDGIAGKKTQNKLYGTSY